MVNDDTTVKELREMLAKADEIENKQPPCDSDCPERRCSGCGARKNPYPWYTNIYNPPFSQIYTNQPDAQWVPEWASG